MRRLKLLFVILCVFVWGCAPLTQDVKLSNKGFEELSKGNYQKAEEYLNQALALNPDCCYALLNMGVVYENTGRIEEARGMYRKVIELNPGDKAGKSAIKGSKGKSLVEMAKKNLKNLEGK